MAQTMTKVEYTIYPLQDKYAKSATELFTKCFCDSEPITKHLGINYAEYEPFAKGVVEKAIKDEMGVVAVDKGGRVIACAIGEDMADPFEANLTNYPKLKPVVALLDKLSKPFLKGKKFKKGKMAHIWISLVAPEYRGQGISTKIDMACANLAVSKGFNFAYAEFTNGVSENITHHYDVTQLCNSISYEDFTMEDGQKPFKGVPGGADAVILGIKPGIKIDSLKDCYIIENT